MNILKRMSRHCGIQPLAGKKLFIALILLCLPLAVGAAGNESISDIREQINRHGDPLVNNTENTRQILADYNPWEEWADPGFGVANNFLAMPFIEYKNKYYYITLNFTEGSEIWRTSINGTWEQFGESGFGYGVYGYLDDMWIYKNILYFSVEGGSNVGANIFKSDGNTIEQVVWNGFDNVFNEDINDLGLYGDYYYIYTANDAQGINFFRTQDGVNYEQVWESGFGNTQNYYIGSLVEFQGYYFMTFRNSDDGFSIYRSPDFENWSLVESGGFGNVENYYIKLTVFNDKLVGVVFPDDYDTNQISVYQSSNGTDYELVTEGFGDTDNDWADIDIYNDYIYVGTYNDGGNGQLHRSQNGEDWEDITAQLTGLETEDDELNVQNIGGQLFVWSWNDTNGTKMWKYNDNNTWTRWNTDGFGSANNMYMYAGVFKNYLAVATYHWGDNPDILRQDLFASQIEDLEIKNVRNKKINLSWSVPLGTNLTTYTIKRYSEPITQDNWYKAKTVQSGKAVDQSKTTQKKKNISLKKKTTYYYGIRTINDQGIKSEISNSSVIIRSLKTKNIKKTHARLKWSADENAFTYTVQLRTKAGKKIRTWQEVSSTKKTIPVGYLNSNTTYKWRVRSVEGDGDRSVWSQYKSFTTK